MKRRLAEIIKAGPGWPRVPSRPFVIAEAGVNHEGSLAVAERLVREAAGAGADAIKFQTYRAGSLAAKDSPAYWDLDAEPTRTQYELFRKYDSLWARDFEKLRGLCDEEKIEFLSTPFDTQSAAFLNELMEVIKISSSDITNLPFIEYLCGFGKPILLSTGASHTWEIDRAVCTIRRHGVPLSLMHCVLNYPTVDANANLGMILDLRARYPEMVIGYSDHTSPGDMTPLTVAATLGAEVLEKHFTHNKSLPGNDHYHAMDKDDLVTFMRRLDHLMTLIGSTKKVALPTEEPARRNARRSLVAARSIDQGKVVEAEDLTWKRPASGVSPAQLDQVLGMKTRRDIAEDELLHWDDFEA